VIGLLSSEYEYGHYQAFQLTTSIVKIEDNQISKIYGISNLTSKKGKRVKRNRKRKRKILEESNFF
jgi:hypothetical protein